MKMEYLHLYKDGVFTFMTNWFASEGLSHSVYDKRLEMRFRFTEALKQIVHELESVAITSYVIPNGNDRFANITKEALFKRIPVGVHHLFAKLAPECICFDENFDKIDKKELAYGNYRLVVQIPSIYIGRHGQDTKLASLMFRVTQIQYHAVDPPCLFKSEFKDKISFDVTESMVVNVVNVHDVYS